MNQELGKLWRSLDQASKLQYAVNTAKESGKAQRRKLPKNPFGLFVREFYANFRQDFQGCHTSSRDVYTRAASAWKNKNSEEKEKYNLLFLHQHKTNKA